jgi:hypothetical protein
MRENIYQMSKALRTLRAVQWSMLASILVYTVLGELVGPRSRGVDPGLSYLFSTLAVGIVGAIFVVRRTLVQRAAASLAADPDDSLSLGHWSTGYFVTYALCEASRCSSSSGRESPSAPDFPLEGGCPSTGPKNCTVCAPLAQWCVKYSKR